MALELIISELEAVRMAKITTQYAFRPKLKNKKPMIKTYTGSQKRGSLSQGMTILKYGLERSLLINSKRAVSHFSIRSSRLIIPQFTGI